MAAESRRRPGSARSGRVASGAEAKVVEWVERYWKVMVTAAVSIVDDLDAAEDLVQRASMRALAIARSDPGRVERIRQPPKWLVRMTRNMAHGVLRTQGRQRRLRRENADGIRENLYLDAEAPKEEDPRAERMREAAPRVLTKRQQQVFLLVRKDMKDHEIARELGLSPGTVRRHRVDATAKLREHMARGGTDRAMNRVARDGLLLVLALASTSCVDAPRAETEGGLPRVASLASIHLVG